MKASQSSLYRALENLYIWCLDASLRVPKTHALQHTAVQLLDEMGDALTACALALQTQSDDVKARLELIDVLIVHLTKVRTLTKVWLAENLHLKLHEKKIYIQPVRHGVKFVGSVVRANLIYLSNTTYSHLYDVMVTAENQCQHYDPRAVESLMPSINSLLGFTRHSDSYNRCMKIVRRLNKFNKYLQFDSHYRVVKIKKEYKLTTLLQRQYELQVQFNSSRDSGNCRGKALS